MTKEDEMSKNNETVDRVQMIWNMIGGDSVVDAIKAGQAKITVEWLKQTEIDFSVWVAFFQKFFGLTANFSGLQIPPKPTEGNWRLLVILQGLTNNLVYNACAKQFPCEKYENDLGSVTKNERDTKNGSSAIWVRDIVEADPVHKNKSADMIKEAGLKTETLLERMLHELVYFSETGEHLDVSNVTLCSGSRDSDGGVPGADWHYGRFRVNWYCAGYRHADLRPREAVAL